jgi:Carboxypeptidase regulatory-like domain
MLYRATAFGVVTVSGDDVSGVRLAPVQRVTASGRIVFADPSAARSVKPSTIRISAQSLNPDDLSGPPDPPAPAVKDDFTFELQVAPGLIMLRPNVPVSQPPSQGPWVLKSLRVNGVDLTDGGIAVRPDENLTGVEIELTNRIAELSGAVSDARGEPAANHTVLVFPQDRDLWTTPGPGRNTMTRSDQNGRFTVRNIRPGRYYGVAVAELDPASWTDPEYLQSVSARATAFSIGEGEKKALDLKVVFPQ